MSNHIELYTPHGKQLAVHEACNNPDLFFISVNAGRQSGDNIINIITKEVYTADWQRVKDYF